MFAVCGGAAALRRGALWSSRVTMATVVSGNKTSQQVKERLKKEVAEMKSQFPGFRPGLVVLQVGDREDSNLYISMKLKAAAEVQTRSESMQVTFGFQSQLRRLKLHRGLYHYCEMSKKVLRSIVAVNENPDVHGLIVQLPLDSINPINTERVTNAVAPEKDVDGLTSVNAGKLSRGDLGDCFIPCTPNGCMELISQTGVSVMGKHAVVIGRSKIVGAPMHDLLLWNHATVTTCHSKTSDLAQQVGRADILVVGAGRAEMVKGEWLKDGALVIDCGINYIPDESKASGKRVVGDVHYPSAKERAGYITPVPGGNTVESAKRFLQPFTPGKWSLVYTKKIPQYPQPSDVEISSSCQSKPIHQLARELGLFSEEVELYGRSRAKIRCDTLKRMEKRPSGKYVVVTGMGTFISPSGIISQYNLMCIKVNLLCVLNRVTSTPMGEGRRTITIGLAQALGAHLNHNTFACLQEPSLKSSTGLMGLSLGSGYSQVTPLEEVTLKPSGQNELISAAGGLLVDTVKAHAHYEAQLSEKTLGIEKSDPLTFTADEIRRFVRLDIDTDTTTDSVSLERELMTILSLSSSEEEMRHRLSQITVASNKSGDVVTADDLNISEPLFFLLKECLKPVLMQAVEGSPVFLHISPLAGEAQGFPSALADKMALKLVGSEGFVVTDAGHGADISLEKFFNIKCSVSGLQPDVVVMVTSIRNLEMYGSAVQAGLPLPYECSQEKLKLLERGCCHLRRQVEKAKAFGLPVIVAVNKFCSDSEAELALVCGQAKQAGALDAVQCSSWSKGGAGTLALAQAVKKAAELSGRFKFLYDSQIPAVDKLRTVAQKVYGLEDIEISPKAKEKLALYTKWGFGNLPVFITNTHLTLTDDHMMQMDPSDSILLITDVRVNTGAGFLCCLTDSTDLFPLFSNSPKQKRMILSSPCFHGNNLYGDSKKPGCNMLSTLRSNRPKSAAFIQLTLQHLYIFMLDD
ncbi:hypothetical protein DNTS_023929 [Danionella cerebrum]|uniref:C-1-tetrahydrofolate synthase, cytoplasmic n=1 Tax=Danionella cerebrum TaxID=2873325 RepID=A0A553MV20_9TELE|nr:hypothetical protein DNTS_023929 [Danionella translucida]